MLSPRAGAPLTCLVSSVLRLGSKVKALQVAERELEQQRKQHHVAKDKLLLQKEGLEQALKTERHVVTEERWDHVHCQHEGHGQVFRNIARRTRQPSVIREIAS